MHEFWSVWPENVFGLRGACDALNRRMPPYMTWPGVFTVFCRFSDAREELDEYQTSSRELEAELETQIEQLEAKKKELLSANSRLQLENENLRVSLAGRWHCEQQCFHSKTCPSPLGDFPLLSEKLGHHNAGIENLNSTSTFKSRLMSRLKF